MIRQKVKPKFNHCEVITYSIIKTVHNGRKLEVYILYVASQRIKWRFLATFFTGADVSSLKQTSTSFDGKILCVISGTASNNKKVSADHACCKFIE